MATLKLYWQYVTISVRSQMQYRASFVMLSLGQFLVTASEFFAIWALFQRFGNLGGWSVYEVGLFYGIVNSGFALAEGLARGFDEFSGLVRSGGFDRILLRPQSSALQIAGREIQVMRIGRLSQGLMVLFWATSRLDLIWTPARIGLVIMAIVGATAMFAGLFILQATLCFWTTESLEVMNTVTYGGTETAQYPLTLYRDWFRKFFTFVVPLATVSYFPAVAILGRTDALGTSRTFQTLAPLIGILFLLVSLRIWEFGVRHYRSTGS